MSLILITGPSRSGKSRYAELLAQRSGLPVTYIATAQVEDPEGDSEWSQRIQKHRLRRPSTWQTLEIPVALPEALSAVAPSRCTLIDSLGTWVANGLDLEENLWQEQVEALLQQLQQPKTLILAVAEEVGWGVVPPYPLGRLFRDRLGYLVQAVGRIASQVFLVTAGFALDLTRLGVAVEGIPEGEDYPPQGPPGSASLGWGETAPRDWPPGSW